MKKFLAVFLALAMVFAMSSVALATETTITKTGDTWTNNPATGPVNVTITNSNVIATVYNVTIDWTALEFSYKVNGTSTWDPAKHIYTTSGEQGWGDSYAANATISNAIKVFNHSNADVTVTPTYDVTDNGIAVALKDKADSAVTVGNALVLKAADEVAYGIAQPKTDTSYANSQVFSVTVSGTPSDISATNVVAGTMKITIGN